MHHRAKFLRRAGEPGARRYRWVVDVLLITGLSGAGRSQVGNTLEDLGWLVIDNLPVELIPKVGELAHLRERGAPLALVTGVSEESTTVEGALEALRGTGATVRTVFLDAGTPTLVRRYGDTKRRHPLLARTGSVETAIEEERRALAPIRAEADYVIDTTDLNVHDLRRRTTELFAERSLGASTQLTVMSFGYKHGVPPDADLVFDCRFLPNPHWVEDLRPLTGLDAEVQEYVLRTDLAKGFVTRLEDMLTYLLPAYVDEGKSVLTVAFGCTGGRHRSVTMAEVLADWLRSQGIEPRVRHRDVGR
jgi:UPF0042 nucleotide-binding protein